MLTSQRIIFEDDTTLNDLSNSLSDFLADTETIPMVLTDDYLYLGSEHPFNHRWFEVSTVNDQASVMSVEVYSNSGWNAAVDVQDDTAVSGVTWARPGIISWHIDDTKGWTKVGDSSSIDELSTTKIFNMYWVRFTVSANLNASSALKYVGFKFANDTDLDARYPNLNKSATKTAFKAGKTTWDDQHFYAAEDLIDYMKRKQIIWTPDQLLEWRIFKNPAIHKVAEIIMKPFGDYADDRKDARSDFIEAMDFRQYKVDQNEDATLQSSEQRVESIGIVRR